MHTLEINLIPSDHCEYPYAWVIRIPNTKPLTGNSKTLVDAVVEANNAYNSFINAAVNLMEISVNKEQQ